MSADKSGFGSWILPLAAAGFGLYLILRKSIPSEDTSPSVEATLVADWPADRPNVFTPPSTPLIPRTERFSNESSEEPGGLADPLSPIPARPTTDSATGDFGNKQTPSDGFNPEISQILHDWFEDRWPAGNGQFADRPAPTPLPPDQSLVDVVRHPSVILILGHRGAGKSALACRLQELLRDRGTPYGIAFPPKAASLLPEWYGIANDAADVPPNAVIYIPESYRLFHARSGQSAQGRAIGDLVNLSRHRRQTLIFDVQNPAHLDRNIISEADMILVKEPGPFTHGFERPQLRPMMDSARAAFSALSAARKKRAVWVVAPGVGITGQLMENRRPSFWTDSLSRIFGNGMVKPGDSVVKSEQRTGPSAEQTPTSGAMATPRRGSRTASQEKRDRARHLHSLGHSYGEIGDMIGVSKSQAFRLINGSKKPRSSR